MWQKRSEEIIDGEFKICFNQGINVRLIHKEGAEYLSKMKYMDDSFKQKRIYTAWDNRRDESIFIKGIDIMTKAGISPKNIMVYMLCGYWQWETFDDIMYRFKKMTGMGLMPYPMVYGNNPLLKKFQRWVIRRYYQFIDWETFRDTTISEYYDKKQKEEINKNFSFNPKNLFGE